MVNRSAWNYLFSAWLFVSVIGTWSVPETAAQDASPTEYRVKAVFLYHFTQFVEWPPNAFNGTDAPLVIGVLGDDPFGPYLQEAIGTEAVSGHPLVVRRFERVADIDTCHVLFIDSSVENRLDQVLEMADGRTLLTVSDIEGFARAGGIIQFVTERGRIRLMVNHEAARSAGLTISSKLLRLADIVTSSRN